MNSPALWCSAKFKPAITATQQDIITKLTTTRPPQCNSSFSFWMRVAKKSNKIPFIRTIPACLQKQQFKYRVLIAWQSSPAFPKTASFTCRLVKMANGIESEQNVVVPKLEDAKQCRFINAASLGAGVCFKELSLEFKTKLNVAVPNDLVMLFFCNNTEVVRSLPISFSSRREGEDKVCPWNTYFDDETAKNRRASQAATLLQQQQQSLQIPSFMSQYLPPPVFNALPATPLSMPLHMTSFSMPSLPPAASSSSSTQSFPAPTPVLHSFTAPESVLSSACDKTSNTATASEAPCLFLYDTEEPLITPPASPPAFEGLQYGDLQSPVPPSPLSRLLASSDMFTASTAFTPTATEASSSFVMVEPGEPAAPSNKTFVQPQNDVLLLLNDDINEESFLLEEELELLMPSVGSKRAREESPTPIEDERAAKSLRLSPFISEPSSCEILM